MALESRYHDSRLAPSEITSLVRQCIRDSNVRVVTKRSNRVDLDLVIVGGAYDSEDDTDGEPCIHLELHYNPDQQHLQIKQLDWIRVSFEICEVIGHEYVHRDQHRRRVQNHPYRGNSQTAEKAYYGEAHEIEAYAYSVAAELVCFYQGDLLCCDQTSTYQMYQKLFADDSQVIDKLDQFIIKYLNKLKVAQDVKTNPRRTTRIRRRNSR